MRLCFRILAFVILVFGNVQHPNALAKQLVPKPNEFKLATPSVVFQLEKEISVSTPAGETLWKRHMEIFQESVQQLNPISFVAKDSAAKHKLIVEKDNALAQEAYRIKITDSKIKIHAASIKGLAHATATLLQMIGTTNNGEPTDSLAACEIKDEPQSSYRSFMIDIGRNAHSLDCLKDTVDLLWFYKVDSFHLHLTDDQRFAFPSKAFPKLVTENGKISWDEFAELEEYANARGVTLIPELEVPGHSTLFRKHYPEVFGETTTDLAKSEKARAGIKVLLDEVIELFPSSPYIHIGGDEAYGVPVDLQRDLINDLYAYLKTNGRKTIVWEGPDLGTGDNKVNPEVIHINWRTIEFPADKMLEAGYPVVNAAWDPLYIVDHYPRNNFTMVSPERIYTQLDLHRFGHFNPDIPTFAKPIVIDKTDIEQNKQLIGFCMPWWEGREENYFPMVVPRIIPMAEIAWNHSQKRDYDDFATRVTATEETRAKIFHPVSIIASPLLLESESVFRDTTTVTLKNDSSESTGDVLYSLSMKEPIEQWKKYDEPIPLKESAVIRSGLFVDGKLQGHLSRRTFTRVSVGDKAKGNLALNKRVSTNVTSGPLFTPARLTDGGIGNLDYFLGYPTEPQPVEITVDLGKETTFNQVNVHTFFNGRAYESYEVQVSIDAKDFTTVAQRLKKPEKAEAKLVHRFPDQRARYVRIVTHGCRDNVFNAFSRLTEIEVFYREDDN